MQDYNDFFIDQSMQFGVGRNPALGIYYVSFPEPTPNRQSDYKVYYELPQDLIDLATKTPVELINFVNECRRGMHKNLRLPS